MTICQVCPQFLFQFIVYEKMILKMLLFINSPHSVLRGLCNPALQFVIAHSGPWPFNYYADNDRLAEWLVPIIILWTCVWVPFSAHILEFLVIMWGRYMNWRIYNMGNGGYVPCSTLILGKNLTCHNKNYCIIVFFSQRNIMLGISKFHK